MTSVRFRSAISTLQRAIRSAFGMFNFVGMSSSILAPTIAGAITDVTGSLAAGFYLSAGLLVMGLVGIMFLKEHKPAKTATA